MEALTLLVGSRHNPRGDRVDPVQRACENQIVIRRQLSFMVPLMRIVKVLRLEYEPAGLVDDPQRCHGPSVAPGGSMSPAGLAQRTLTCIASREKKATSTTTPFSGTPTDALFPAMRPDLVAVLSDSTLRELTDECTILISRSFPEEQRGEWIDALGREASQVDESTDASSAIAPARELVGKLVKSTPGMIECTDRELEGLYNLLTTLLLRYYQPEEAPFEDLLMHMVHAMGDAQSPTAMERSVIKYRILTNMFNMLPPPSPLRRRVFEVLLALVSANDDMDFLETALQSVPHWLAQWDVSVQEKHECLSRIAEALVAPECGPSYNDKAYEFELLHLRFISAEPSLTNEVRHAAAERAIAHILRLPKLYEMEELLHVPVTLELASSPVLSLLKIMVGGSRVDFESWAQTSEARDAMHRLQLNEEQLLHKMRLLDLASLCARSVSAEVSYEDLAQALHVPVDEVESWVIDVIRAGLVSGKLSQVQRTFRVYRSTYRSFEKAQWEALEQRLTRWQSSIQTLLRTMDQARTQMPAALVTEQAHEASEA